jgi:outer membrane immunogenic protein
MKKFLAACIAAAAFCAEPAFAAPPAAPVFDWTGFYIGGQVGGGWHASQGTRLNNPSPDFPIGFVSPTLHTSGFLGGGYAGFNYQIDRFVIGIDGDYSWANLSGSNTSVGLFGATDPTIGHQDWIATLAGRLGYAINDWMLFGKAGWAWEGVHANGEGFSAAGVFTGVGINPEHTRNGWTFGTGIEWGFARNWSAKLEYDYVKFNTANVHFIIVPSPAGPVSINQFSVVSSLNMVKLGIAYRY